MNLIGELFVHNHTQKTAMTTESSLSTTENVLPAEEEGLRILLVEDDPDDREFFSYTLNQMQFPHVLHMVHDSEELFKALHSHTLPHLIFLDINLPLPNGFHALQLLKAGEFKDIPVIMYSTADRKEDIQKAYAEGAHHYIVKPHVPSNLLSTLKQVFQRDWKKPQAVPDVREFVVDIAYLS
jgi:CheY-like chemotaxis protein